MRIKYLGTKAVIVLVTTLTTPIVWAALAWPEWSSASPVAENEDVITIGEPAPQGPQVLIQQVIHRVVVVPRYIEVEATPSIAQTQPQANASAPATTPTSAPTAAPTSIPQVVAPPSPARPGPVQQPAASGNSSGNNGSSSSSNTSATSGSSNPPADTGGSTAPPPSNSKTKGS
jgi:hypothetical protein